MTPCLPKQYAHWCQKDVFNLYMRVCMHYPKNPNEAFHCFVMLFSLVRPKASLITYEQSIGYSCTKLFCGLRAEPYEVRIMHAFRIIICTSLCRSKKEAFIYKKRIGQVKSNISTYFSWAFDFGRECSMYMIASI